MQPLCADCLVQRVGQHVQSSAHFRHALAFVQQQLCPFFQIAFQQSRRPPLGRRVEAFRPAVPIQSHIPLHRPQRHIERSGHIDLPDRPVDYQLAGEQTKARQIFLRMSEHWQVPMHVYHRPFLALERYLRGDRCGARRKYRQL